jgi:uncharacterized coiled-coil DUF342 family protein
MSKRDAHIQKLHAKIDEWNADIDKLAAKTQQAEADVRIEYQEQIDALKRQRREVENELADLKQSGEGAWEDLSAGLDLAFESMNEAVESAMSRFKKH